MTDGPARLHASRHDAWIVLLVGSGAGLPFGLAYRAAFAGEPPGTVATLAGAGVLVLALLLGVAWPVLYAVERDALVVHAGRLLRWRVPLAAVRSVRPSRNPLSAPAWSLDRLRIDYTTASGRGRFLLVSPADRAAFLRDLAAAEPALVPDGEGLRRAAAA